MHFNPWQSSQRTILALFFLGAGLMSCSSTYRENTSSFHLYSNKDLNSENWYLVKGRYIAIEYGHSSKLKARWGKVYDGGSGQTLYVIFIDPTVLNEPIAIPWNSNKIKVYYSFHADPGLYARFKGAQLKHGYIKNLHYEKGDELKAEINLPRQKKNHAFHVIKSTLTFKSK